MVNCWKEKLRKARLVSKKIIIENDFNELDKLGKQSEKKSAAGTMWDENKQQLLIAVGSLILLTGYTWQPYASRFSINLLFLSQNVFSLKETSSTSMDWKKWCYNPGISTLAVHRLA